MSEGECEFLAVDSYLPGNTLTPLNSIDVRFYSLPPSFVLFLFCCFVYAHVLTRAFRHFVAQGSESVRRDHPSRKGKELAE